MNDLEVLRSEGAEPTPALNDILGHEAVATGWEAFTRNPAETPVVFDSGVLSDDNPLMLAVTRLRTRFVRHQKWLDLLPGQVDGDRYDNNASTTYFATGLSFSSNVNKHALANEVEVDACMRLTWLNDAKESLSLDMWGDWRNSSEFQDSLQHHLPVLTESASIGRLLDLTRLATDYDSRLIPDSKERRLARGRAIVGCFELIGAGLDRIMPAEEIQGHPLDIPTVCMFTMSNTLRTLMSLTGIHFEVIFEEKISPDDRNPSALAYCKLYEDIVATTVDIPDFVDARQILFKAMTNNLRLQPYPQPPPLL